MSLAVSRRQTKPTFLGFGCAWKLLIPAVIFSSNCSCSIPVFFINSSFSGEKGAREVTAMGSFHISIVFYNSARFMVIDGYYNFCKIFD